ncbi:Fic family protein [Bradyrhizobium symbiodeficiens]|uniref:Fic family protein n=1 Tax=Bradyrhizobium symbiodeficiens TaxID=1404367 RepID=A0A6G9AAS0_9BRAD|nr:Fic family protein [Bradyrhizobium symbiodeficiens]QIP09541.1 Fic family protein [Bradyrhizobium symbiodeficiens]
MTGEEGERRHSKALEPELIKDPKLKAEAEAANGLRQYDFAVQAVQTAIERQPFRLRLSLILSLQREALQGISAYAGLFRPGDVKIQHSKHVPPGAHMVPELVEDLCEYVNDHWEASSPIHLAAYVMWRLNWIHPFADGNGRTSRILSFFVLFARLGALLPGTPTLPDLIIDHRDLYEAALDDADEACRQGKLDVSKMEHLVEALLAKQLARVYELAAGKAVLGGVVSGKADEKTI